MSFLNLNYQPDTYTHHYRLSVGLSSFNYDNEWYFENRKFNGHDTFDRTYFVKYKPKAQKSFNLVCSSATALVASFTILGIISTTLVSNSLVRKMSTWGRTSRTSSSKITTATGKLNIQCMTVRMVHIDVSCNLKIIMLRNYATYAKYSLNPFHFKTASRALQFVTEATTLLETTCNQQTNFYWIFEHVSVI